MDAALFGSFKRARAELGVESFGMQVIDLPPSFDGYPIHDHTHDDQEEVYIALRGGGELEVDGERMPLDDDHIARVGPAARRKVYRARRDPGADPRRCPRPSLRRHRRTRSAAPTRKCRDAPSARTRAARSPGSSPPGSAGSAGTAVVRERSQREKTEPRVFGTSFWWRQESQRPTGGRGGRGAFIAAPARTPPRHPAPHPSHGEHVRRVPITRAR